MIVNTNGATVSTTHITGYLTNIGGIHLICHHAGGRVPTSRRRLSLTLTSNIRFYRLLTPGTLGNTILAYSIVRLNRPSTDNHHDPITANRAIRLPTAAIVYTINRNVSTDLCSTTNIRRSHHNHLTTASANIRNI